MLAELAAGKLAAGELNLARSYLTGSLPVSLATARQRMRVGVQLSIFGLPRDFPQRTTAQIDALTLDEARAAAARWLHPDQLATVVVGTADVMRPHLDSGRFGELAVAAWDSY
jgi:zinc protease